MMFKLYLLTRLDSILDAADICIVSCIVAFLVLGAAYLISLDLGTSENISINIKKYINKLKYFSCIAIPICCLIEIAVPSQKEAAFIYVGSKLMNNEKVVNIGNDTLDLTSKLITLANQYVDKNLKPKESK